MKFRPCIDLHEGVVKQIVGSSLTENDGDQPSENFVSTKDAAHYARLYSEEKLYGGHIIMLGKGCDEAALRAIAAFPQGMQIGGGINDGNALQYLQAGASHVIVTSHVFNDGRIDFDRLQSLCSIVRKERLVIDLSCRRRPGDTSGLFFVVTNKWTKFTDFAVTIENLVRLSQYCDEFLVHGVDVEGKRAGIEEELVALLGEFAEQHNIPITYAGGVRSMADLELVRRLGRDKVDCTVGSALDCFGGDMSYREVVDWHHSMNS